jgi:hypothetical protein
MPVVGGGGRDPAGEVIAVDVYKGVEAVGGCTRTGVPERDEKYGEVITENLPNSCIR